MDIPRRLRPALLATLLAGTLGVTTAAPAPASPLARPPTGPTSPTSPASPTGPASPASPTSGVGSPGTAGPCHVVATSRTGRAWLPSADLVVPGRRALGATVVVGAAAVDVVDGLVRVQRTSRRSPAAAVPVELVVTLDGAGGPAEQTCSVDLGLAHVDGSTRLRRVARAG